MKKKLRHFKVDYTLDWGYGVAISKIREDLDVIEKLGATHVDIDVGKAYGDSFLEIKVYSERMETDEECLEREEKQKKWQDEIKRHDLELLEELQKRYGIKNT